MFERRKLHLVDPKTGSTRWYLPVSAMTLVFGTLLFPLITRRLWGWLAVFMVYDLIAVAVTIAQDGMTDASSQGIDRVFNAVALPLAVLSAVFVNKQATRKFLAQGWLVSAKTTEDAWQHFRKAWALPDNARQPATSPLGRPMS